MCKACKFKIELKQGDLKNGENRVDPGFDESNRLWNLLVIPSANLNGSFRNLRVQIKIKTAINLLQRTTINFTAHFNLQTNP